LQLESRVIQCDTDYAAVMTGLMPKHSKHLMTEMPTHPYTLQVKTTHYSTEVIA